MEPVNLLLVGCGMMGARHLRGMAELEATAPGTLNLLGVCDMREDSARKVADEAEQLLGSRPGVFTSVEAALAAEPSLQAVDVVTDPRSHDDIVIPLFEAGLDVICEKPLTLTVARGRRLVDAARQAGRILATAENNRRDPMNRLCRACIDGGLIGVPNFAFQISVIPADRIIATAWRHRLAMGGLILDVAIHMGYILEYLLGPIGAITAQTQLIQSSRSGNEFDGTHVDVEVDSEDCLAALLDFEGGWQGQWTGHFASAGDSMFQRTLFGSEGTIDCPADRSGRAVNVRRGADLLTGDDLLAELPDYHLNDIETRLFGERRSSYSLEGAATDRKLIAAELYDFIDAIRTGGQPEVDGATGLRAVAIIYAILESSLKGRTATMEEVLGGGLRDYQDTVEAAGL